MGPAPTRWSHVDCGISAALRQLPHPALGSSRLSRAAARDASGIQQGAPILAERRRHVGGKGRCLLIHGWRRLPVRPSAAPSRATIRAEHQSLVAAPRFDALSSSGDALRSQWWRLPLPVVQRALLDRSPAPIRREESQPPEPRSIVSQRRRQGAHLRLQHRERVVGPRRPERDRPEQQRSRFPPPLSAVRAPDRDPVGASWNSAGSPARCTNPSTSTSIRTTILVR